MTAYNPLPLHIATGVLALSFVFFFCMIYRDGIRKPIRKIWKQRKRHLLTLATGECQCKICRTRRRTQEERDRWLGYNI